MRISRARRSFQHPQGGAPRGLLARSRRDCGDAYGGVFVFGGKLLRSQDRWRGCPERVARFTAPTEGGRGRLPVRCPIAGPSQAFCIFVRQARQSEASGWFYRPGKGRWAAMEGSARPFAARLRGRIKRFACFRRSTPLPSMQLARMSRARRLFWPPDREAAREGVTRPYAA